MPGINLVKGSSWFKGFKLDPKIGFIVFTKLGYRWIKYYLRRIFIFFYNFSISFNFRKVSGREISGLCLAIHFSNGHLKGHGQGLQERVGGASNNIAK